jgi:hypothetical protein
MNLVPSFDPGGTVLVRGGCGMLMSMRIAMGVGSDPADSQRRTRALLTGLAAAS